MNSKIKIGMMMMGVLVLTGMIGEAAYLFGKKQAVVSVSTNKTPDGNSLADLESKDEVQNNNSSAISVTSEIKTPLIMQDDIVDWYSQPKVFVLANLYKKNEVTKDYSMNAWEVGAMKNGQGKVIFVAIDTDGPGGVVGYLFITDNNSDEQRLRSYSRYSSDNFLSAFNSESIGDKVIPYDYSYERINSLDYPGFLFVNDMVFQYEKDEFFSLEDPFFHPEKFAVYKKIYADKVYGDVFENTENGGFYLKSPIGIAKLYSLKVDFLDGNIPQIKWNDGAKEQDPFTYKGASGCGSYKYADVVDGQVLMSELAVTGKTNTGEIIYEYKDKNADYLKKWYQENVDFVKNVGGGMNSDKFKETTTYEEFVGHHLVFFWKDSLGRLTRFINLDYVFMGGCGKPVIYLYPEKTEKISVKVRPAGGMTISDPAYSDGWQVISDPQSNITNLADGKVYPYLFWEGRGNSVYQMPQAGFVISQDNLKNTLSEKLALTGLNQKEIDDFEEFWLPKMLKENKPYYFVTFVSQREIEKLAPLSVAPWPDTVIRVLMDYQGLDEYKVVPQLKITTPERKGFTVVEWGGVLR